MKLAEFITALGDLPKSYEIYRQNAGRLWWSGAEMCPITAVYRHRKRRFLDMNRVAEAGKRLGLTPRVTARIVQAADGDLGEEKLKNRMLRAIEAR